MLIYIKIFGSGVKISARLRSRSAIFGKIRFDSVDFSQLADRALPRARCTIHYEVLQLQRANLAQPDTLSLSLSISPPTLPHSPSPTQSLVLETSLQRGSILLPLRLRLRPTTYYYSYYYYSYSTTARTRLLLLSLLLRTILLLSPSSTVTATIEVVPNICRRILSQLLMVPLQLLPQLYQQRPEKEK